MNERLQEQFLKFFSYSNPTWYNIILTIFYGIFVILFVATIVGIIRRKKANQPLKIGRTFFLFLGILLLPLILLLILRIGVPWYANGF